jgi:hypothetical protein
VPDVFSIIAFVAVSAAIYLTLRLAGRYQVRLDARLVEARGQRGTGGQALTATSEELAAGSARRPSSFINRLLPESDADRLAYQHRLLQAGISHPAGLSIFFAARLAMMIAPPLMALALGTTGWLSLQSGRRIGNRPS